MYRVITYIRITQKPTRSFPSRKAVLNFDFVNAFTAEDAWDNLTDKGSVTLPKNLYYKDAAGHPQPLSGTNICIGGFDGDTPLFLRGDEISIESGYKYYTTQGAEIIDTSIVFEGFITKVHSRIPITLDLEDNMWKLKQIPAPTITFKETDTLERILETLLKGTGFTWRALTSTTFGEFQVGNETVAQAIYRLKKMFGFEFFFKGSQLCGGARVYLRDGEEGNTSRTEIFRFQKNIIDDDLEYERKDDIVLSAICHNTIEERTGKTCKDGTAKMKRKRLEVLVTIKNDEVTIKEVPEGSPVPENTEGERREFFFPGAKTVDALGKLGEEQLRKFYYTGLRGKFTTFGIPHVESGDNADIKDPKLPERNGVYKIKAVEYTGGVAGNRQIITLDFKLNNVKQSAL